MVCERKKGGSSAADLLNACSLGNTKLCSRVLEFLVRTTFERAPISHDIVSRVKPDQLPVSVATYIERAPLSYDNESRVRPDLPLVRSVTHLERAPLRLTSMKQRATSPFSDARSHIYQSTMPKAYHQQR